MNLLTILGGFKPYGTAIIAGCIFGAGIYTANVYHGYKESKQLKDIEANTVMQNIINRQTVDKLQTSIQKKDEEYQLLKEKLNEIQVTNVPCKLTPSAVRVWNKSSGIKGLPKDTTGTPKETTSTSGVETNPIEGVGIKLILENKIENDKINSAIRQQLESIIQWDKDTWGNTNDN